MLEPICRRYPQKPYSFKKRSSRRPRGEIDLNLWQRSNPPYEYSYLLNNENLRNQVSSYFITVKTIKLIDVYQLVQEINKLVRSIPKKKSSKSVLRTETNKSTLNDASTSHAIIEEDENSNDVANVVSSSSSKSLARKQSYLAELANLAAKSKHYPMRLDEPILTSEQKCAILAGVDMIMESTVDLDPIIRKLIALDAQHFSFNLLFPKRKRKAKWTYLFDFSTSGWPFAQQQTNK